MKVSDLTGPQLDCWVAKAEGKDNPRLATESGYAPTELDPIGCRIGPCEGFLFSPSSYWSHAGPIIEREGIGIAPDSQGPWKAYKESSDKTPRVYIGNTPLEAAMRRYVASKFGDEAPD